MSLDVYLTASKPQPKSKGSGIFVRRNGQTEEISREEWDKAFPGREPFVVSQEDDDAEDSEVFSANITHNLNRMAHEAGIYDCLWRPDENGITKAKQIIEPLERGIALMKADPARFEALNASNGWGLYENFVPWCERYLAACRDNPEAEVSVSR